MQEQTTTGFDQSKSIRSYSAPVVFLLLLSLLLSVSAVPVSAGPLTIQGFQRDSVDDKTRTPAVSQRCYCPELGEAEPLLKLEREHPWSLPRRALSASAPQLINILVLRVSFPLETPDNPLTTGRGKMDFRSLAEFAAEYGHEIDPSPHDSSYFDSHLKALRSYYTFVSRGAVDMTWSIFPAGDTMTYELPREMAYYGDSALVEERLTDFFVDCITVADTDPSIVFRDYDAVVIFHAGSDRQNDIGFPETPYDLFTGFIKSGIPVDVDGGDTTIASGLFMPEQASQDNRSTALNAVFAHEFAHQLGLVDLYSTRNFFTQLGDFALMDNNGFGVGIDLGFESVFQSFGIFPIYMSAWSRAYLGFDSVVVMPMGSSIALAAAALDTAGAARLAKVPISRYEYYLVENRQPVTFDLSAPFVWADSVTGVIWGPARNQINPFLSGEYDFLLPGDGLLIYHVDESVAFGDHDEDGLPNFQDNDLQWDPDHRFIRLVEADGFVDFGGYYFKGVGSASDMWNPGTFNSFTPNTNPATKANSGAHTHLRISVDTSDNLDHNITISASNDRAVTGFPVWGGLADAGGLSPIAVAIDSLPGEEFIFASGNRVIVVGADGGPGWNFVSSFAESLFVASTEDTLDYFIGGDTTAVVDRQIYPINLLALTPNPISAGPVVAQFADTTVIAVGAGDTVYAFGIYDSNPFGAPQPDRVWKFNCGAELADLAFNSASGTLYAVGNSGSGHTILAVTTLDGPGSQTVVAGRNAWSLALSDSLLVKITTDPIVGAPTIEFGDPLLTSDAPSTGRSTLYGPAVSDLDRDGTDEVVVASADGYILAYSIEYQSATPALEEFVSAKVADSFTTAPSIGDVDSDGYPDIVVGGPGAVYAFTQQLVPIEGFPAQVDKDFPGGAISGQPLIVDVELDRVVDAIVGAELHDTLSAGVFALSQESPLTFPLPAGGQLRGSPVIAETATGFSVGYLCRDGFFYNWRLSAESGGAQWRMADAASDGSANFDAATLPSPAPLSGGIAENSFYSYPNPVRGASATLRYTLGRDASTVSITVFDLSGQIMDEYSGSGFGGFANEVTMDCSELTPGVYRVTLSAVFSDGEETVYTDVAVVR